MSPCPPRMGGESFGWGRERRARIALASEGIGMMTRALLVCLIACGLAFSGGCACGPCWNAPFGPGTLCDSGGGTCGPAAGRPVCQPACESSGEPAPAPLRGPACSTCGEVCGGACASACGDPCCMPCGPLTWLFEFLSQGYCGESCGETWWGDWHGAPPDCFDPCDRCGNYTGRAGVPGGCESCGQRPSGSVHRISTTTAEPEVVAERYAPRLVSTTDRAVARSVPQAELPRQRPANQGR
jgi:hypothetical protein